MRYKNMRTNNMVFEQEKLQTACYIRLSREDGDKSESLSIANQRLQLTQFVTNSNDLTLYDYYIDDGYTGTNFERPNFMRMIEDIENQKIQCIVVKDLSRLGRDMPRTTSYIKEYFPSKKVRFISINDSVDKKYYDVDTSEDMMIDFKNMFNGFYPRDIASKVRSTFRSKQGNGQFIGAFPCYGYKKSSEDHNQLIIDEEAANVVRRIFQMYLSGMGQLTIVKQLNSEGIPCPTEYKKQCGLKYHNSNRLNTTSYWTYATIHKILQNEMYIGNMVQNKSFRQVCKTKAISLPKEQWIIVENTHEAIIDKDTWDKVQSLLARGTRQLNLQNNIHIFAGFLRCGDCDRAMVKIKRSNGIFFNCGSYNRYGNKFCSMHHISELELEQIVLNDLNTIIQSVKNIQEIVEEEQQKNRDTYINSLGDISNYQNEIDRLTRKKERSYQDYSDDIISRDEYIKYKSQYEKEIATFQAKIDTINQLKNEQTVTSNPWLERLLQFEKIEHLDRETVVEIISMIYIYENHTVKIIYNFSNELDVLLQNTGVVHQSDISPAN